MASWFFASDLHGAADRYEKLFQAIRDERPAALLLGGDLLPSSLSTVESSDFAHQGFVNGFLVRHLNELREELGSTYPGVFLILGNDDRRSQEAAIVTAAATGVWHYIHGRRVSCHGHDLYGYAHVPPTPFLLKDWERYDVSRYVDPGCVSPEEGYRSVPVPEHQIRYATIKDDLSALVGDRPLDSAILLFHSPPYKSALDRAAMDGKVIDHVPLDVHVGSIAIQRFIRERQPLITLHGHIHESARLTGSWSERTGRTHSFTAAHDGPELALVRFDPADPGAATRTLM